MPIVDTDGDFVARGVPIEVVGKQREEAEAILILAVGQPVGVIVDTVITDLGDLGRQRHCRGQAQ